MQGAEIRADSLKESIAENGGKIKLFSEYDRRQYAIG
jgi:hypothetical protein